MPRPVPFICFLLAISAISCASKTPPMNKVSIDELSPPTPQPVLYVFAHQDDEMFVSPKMILEVNRGTPITAVWITDGGKSANPKQRQEESTAAMQMIGVPRERLHFL